MSNSHIMQASEIEIQIEGMDCTGCAHDIEQSLKRRGYKDATVDFLTKRATLLLADNQRFEDALHLIEELGYRPRIPDRYEPPEPWWSLERKLLFAAIWTVPLLLHMVAEWHWLHNPWIQLLLCLPVFLLGCAHFGLSAWRSLRLGIANMDVLIFGGSLAAFSYSLYGTINAKGPQFLFYETAATIIFAVLIGNYLERRALRKATSAIDELSRLQAATARRITSTGLGEIIEDIPAAQVAKGDVLLINHGDRIPADGVIIQGAASIDQSMITGESLPVESTLDSKVIGGTIVVHGTARMQASNVGDNTVLSEIIRLVRDAQRSKPSIQRLGDRVSNIFVPVVVLLAVLTFALSLAFGVTFVESLLRSVAVLVVACPCAMGLATPTAVSITLGKAARQGILLKGGLVIEQLARVQQVVFDKTGTLTTGQFKVTRIESIGISSDEARSILKALELHSSHPIARSIVAYLNGVQAAALHDLLEVRGVGMQGSDSSGNRYKLERDPEAAGQTELCLALYRNDIKIATITLTDEPRPGAKQAIQELAALGIPSAIMSGDTEGKVAAFAREYGIAQWHSEQLPQQKLELLEQYERRGMSAYVGDGINDAPALARATVGVALSDGTQVAVQSAQVVLLKGALEALPTAIQLCRAGLRTIKQNLFWAFAYNVIAIPLAALGYLSPMVAAFSMIFSDFVVIGNSLRYRFIAANLRSG